MQDQVSKNAQARRTYTNSPLTEALVEVYFAETSDLTVWGQFYHAIKDQYPEKEQATFPSFEATSDGANPDGAQFTLLPMARFFKSDRSQLVQVTNKFITVNQLRPYCGYEKFRSDMEHAVDTFVNIANPQNVLRVGVRYINRIVIPEERLALQAYFKFMPQIPGSVTENISGVSLQVQFAARDSKHMMTASLRSDISKPETGTALFLDIYDVVEINNSMSLKLILKETDEAHENIERAFEGFITSKARTLFGEVKND